MNGVAALRLVPCEYLEGLTVVPSGLVGDNLIAISFCTTHASKSGVQNVGGPLLQHVLFRGTSPQG